MIHQKHQQQGHKSEGPEPDPVLVAVKQHHDQIIFQPVPMLVALLEKYGKQRVSSWVDDCWAEITKKRNAIAEETRLRRIDELQNTLQRQEALLEETKNELRRLRSGDDF